MNDQEIIQYAERIATGWPARPASAARVRFACSVLTLTPDGPGALRLRVAIEEATLAASLRAPGQYATLGVGELEPRFGVIAQAPHEQRGWWDFLITRDSTLGRALGELEAGQPVLVSEAEGPGFDVKRLDGEPLLIFATGTGIATARPIIQHLLHTRPEALRRCAVYYGERRWDSFAYDDEIARWIGAGCAVWRVSELGEDGAPGALRYVQQAFVRDLRAGEDLSRATAMLAGAPPMLRAVSAELMTRGVLPERILTNM